MQKDKLTYRLIDKSRILHNCRYWRSAIILIESHRKLIDRQMWAMVREEVLMSEIVTELVS